MGRGLMLPGFWWGDVSERDYFKYLGLEGKIILKGT
jgi:hypothetical protein